MKFVHLSPEKGVSVNIDGTHMWLIFLLEFWLGLAFCKEKRGHHFFTLKGVCNGVNNLERSMVDFSYCEKATKCDVKVVSVEEMLM